MAIDPKSLTVDFRSLLKMTVQERVEMAKLNPSYLASLTPTQYAMLFPSYYRKKLPDLGLSKATSGATPLGTISGDGESATPLPRYDGSTPKTGVDAPPAPPREKPKPSSVLKETWDQRLVREAEERKGRRPSPPATGGSSLRAVRSRQMKELDNAEVRAAVLARAEIEVGGQPGARGAWLETLFNRSAATGKSLLATVNNSDGYYPQKDNAKWKRLSAALPSTVESKFSDPLSSVGSGANETDYATDNASSTLADERQSRFGGIRRNGELFYNNGEVPTYTNWAQKQRKLDAEEARKKATGVLPEDAAKTGAVVPPDSMLGPKEKAGKKAGFTVLGKSRDELSEEERKSVAGNRIVSLDFNDAGKSAKGVEVIIPDDATDEERARAEQYVKDVKKYFEDRGYKNYPIRGVFTTSENRVRNPNGGGKDGYFHTEPFFAQDKKAVEIITGDPDGYAAIIGSTFGTLPGVRIIPPHEAGKPGASIPDGLSERQFAIDTLMPALQRFGEKLDTEAPSIEPLKALPEGLDPRIVADFNTMGEEKKQKILESMTGFSVDEINGFYGGESATAQTIREKTDEIISGKMSETGFLPMYDEQGLPGPYQNVQNTAIVGTARRKGTRKHWGADYYVPEGVALKAQGRGKVTYIGSHNEYGTGNYGRTVVVQYDNGYTVQYSHLSPESTKGFVKVGDIVEGGQQIAITGASGTQWGVGKRSGATPPHVHAEVVRNEDYKGGLVKSAGWSKMIQPHEVFGIKKYEMDKELAERFERETGKKASVDLGYIQRETSEYKDWKKSQKIESPAETVPPAAPPGAAVSAETQPNVNGAVVPEAQKGPSGASIIPDTKPEPTPAPEASATATPTPQATETPPEAPKTEDKPKEMQYGGTTQSPTGEPITVSDSQTGQRLFTMNEEETLRKNKYGQIEVTPNTRRDSEEIERLAQNVKDEVRLQSEAREAAAETPMTRMSQQPPQNNPNWSKTVTQISEDSGNVYKTASQGRAFDQARFIPRKDIFSLANATLKS